MKLVQRIEISTEMTEEELKHVDLDEYQRELYGFIKSEADESAFINVEVTIEK